MIRYAADNALSVNEDNNARGRQENREKEKREKGARR